VTSQGFVGALAAWHFSVLRAAHIPAFEVATRPAALTCTLVPVLTWSNDVPPENASI
jgi:hypothetical protein